MSESSGAHRVRAGDDDRERIVEALRGHHEAGRIDQAEFTERMEAALAARWLDELPPLLVDLPAGSAPGSAGAGAPGFGPQWGAFPGGPQTPPSFVRAGVAAGWPLLVALAVFAIVGSVAAVAHGHFPFPLLWLLFGLFAVKPWLRRRWHHARAHG
jgi:Domain of unknown function (DUF1707)